MTGLVTDLPHYRRGFRPIRHSANGPKTAIRLIKALNPKTVKSSPSKLVLQTLTAAAVKTSVEMPASTLMIEFVIVRFFLPFIPGGKVISGGGFRPLSFVVLPVLGREKLLAEEVVPAPAPRTLAGTEILVFQNHRLTTAAGSPAWLVIAVLVADNLVVPDEFLRMVQAVLEVFPGILGKIV